MSTIHTNFMETRFASRSENESFARVAVASFVSQLDPTMEEVTDIKTVVSEAVTNAIIHGYEERTDGEITIRTEIDGNRISIQIEDQGVGIADVDKARLPLFHLQAGTGTFRDGLHYHGKFYGSSGSPLCRREGNECPYGERFENPPTGCWKLRVDYGV